MLVGKLIATGFPDFTHCPLHFQREGYGWVEFVASQPCHSIEDARQFAYNAGIVQAVLLIINAVDFHDENVRAACDKPVLLDLEGLFHPTMRLMRRKRDARRSRELEWRRIANSVLGTGYLPEWIPMIGGTAYGIGGLNHDCGGDGEYLDIRDANLDSMHVARSRAFKKWPENAAFFDGKPLDIGMFIEDFLRGFRTGYQRIADQTVAYGAIFASLAALPGLEGRFILRATRLYDMLARKSVEPVFLRNGASRSMQYEVLRRTRLFGFNATNWDRIVDAEIFALERLNIPRFVASSIGRDLLLPNGVEIKNQFPSYLRTLKDSLTALSAAHLEEQLSLCSTAFRSGSNEGLFLNLEKNACEETSAVGKQSKDYLLQFALCLCEKVATSARCSDGGAVWLGLVPFSWELHSQLRVLDDDLYAGNAGIAISLAAMGRFTGRQSFVDLALMAIAPLRSELRSAKRLKGTFGSMPLGIGNGLGSIIYSLTVLSDLLNDSELLYLARVASGLITRRILASEGDCDVMQGSAGAILGLLALFGATGEPDALARATMCGSHLVGRMSDVGDRRSWTVESGPALVGFAHGASGIVYALGCLLVHTQDEQLKGAIKDGLDYERSRFRSSGGRWPDLRPGRGLTEACQWCHGAVGVGFARMALMEIMPAADIATDLDSAIESCLNCATDDADHLCCGNFGRIEFLFEAGRRLAREDLIAAAQKRIDVVIGAGDPQSLRWRTGAVERKPWARS